MPHDVESDLCTVGADLSEAWKYYYRNDEPDKAHVALGTLQKLWKEMKFMGLILRPRKKEWEDLCAGFRRSDARQAARQKAEGDARQERTDAIQGRADDCLFEELIGEIA